MSLPRAVIPNRIYMITRRCSERRFFMRPDGETNNAFIYCLAVAAQKYGVLVIFTSAMSNHHHTGVVDVDGKLPEFLAYFHKLFAKHQNALRGRWEAFWAPEQTSAVELVDGPDILEKMIYALTNPVKDHLVERVHHWPGVNALAAICAGEPLAASRPKTFFRPDGDMPERAVLSFHSPKALDTVASSGIATILKERVEKAELDAASERLQTGRRLVRRAMVRKQYWGGKPHSAEMRSEMNPRLACRNTWRRIEALVRNRTWLEAYKVARQRFLAGLAATFPHGTYWLNRFAGVCCEAAPSA